jgi:hypothetical protein
MNAFCYSQRILNPFRGVMNIITTETADAVTIDGVNWSLYIHDTFGSHHDDPEEFAKIEMPDIRFGEWNKKNGLRRAPVLPSYYYDEIQQVGADLLEAVFEYADKIPFAFSDNYELWLLDEEHDQPLALLDSVCSKQEIYIPSSLQWKAGNRCKQYFRSSVVPDTKEKIHADILNQLVNTRAGKTPGAQWFFRRGNHHGLGLSVINTDERYVGREMSPRMFPRMFIEQQWDNDSECALFVDFVNWLSPWLLLMDFLSDAQRESFETTARQHALLVDEMHLLYPKVISEKDIKAARVEAAFRKSAPASEESDEPLHISYRET